MSYRRKVIFGVGWLSILQVATQITSFIKLIILSRILIPADFGLYALVTATIITFETLSDTGLSYAVIHLQMEVKKIAKTLLLISIGRGILLSALILSSGPLLSLFFKNTNLVSLLLIASIIPFLRGFINPHTINFQKELDFKKYFTLQFIPVFTNLVFSLLFVVFYKSALALVLGLVVSTAIEVITSYLIAERDISQPIQKIHFKSLFSYGKWITLGGFVTYMSTQIDNIIIGKFLGTASLGLYDISFRLANIAFTQITDTISQVMFPYYSKIQNDIRKLLFIYKRNTLLVALPALVICIVLFTAPKQILLLAFGSQWVQAADTLRILAIYGFLRAAIGPIGPIMLAIGKPSILTKLNAINFIMLVILIIPMAISFGLNGVAWSMTISYIVIVPFYIYELFRNFKIKLAPFIT